MVGIVVTDAYALADGVEYGRSLTRTDKLDMATRVSDRPAALSHVKWLVVAHIQ